MKKITLLCFAFLAFSFYATAQDTCATATPLTPGTQQCDDTANVGDTFDDSNCLGNYDGGNDYLFMYTAGLTGETLQLTMTSSGTWTGIGISEGCPEAGGGTCFGSSTSSSGDESFTSDPLTAGMVYYIHISTWPSPQTADFCLDSTVITCIAPTATTTLSEDCANGQFSVDVDVTSLGNATTVTISNDGGVAAITGIAATGIVTVGPFTASSGVNITLEHDGDSDCNVELGSFIDACPPSNDECMGAIAVACDDVVSSSTTSASDSGVGNAANDLWYSYSGPAGDITASTCTMGYDTALFVYSDCGTTLITSNDDSCGTQSSVTFTADGTSTYYIVVDGYNTSSGAFELTIDCAAAIPAPANDECMAAEALVFATPSSGTTAGATENVTEEKPACDIFGAIADVWYTVEITGGTSDLTLVTTPTGTSDQANVAVYSACGGLQADSLGCDDTGEAAGESLTVAGLDNGTYYVRVWSDGTAARNSQRVEGGFDIVADATLSTQDINANGLAFTYYPNPVNDNLALKAQKDIENVSVYNMLGQEVLRTVPNAVNTEVNMSALQSGAYFVKVTIGNATETVRILKN